MVELVAIDKSEYQDGSVWIKYNQGKKYCGFELRYPEDLLDNVSEDKIPLTQLACADILKPLVDFESHILYIEEDDSPKDYKEYLDKLNRDCEEYPELRDFIITTDYPDGHNTITIYGDIITKVLFPRD